MIMKTVLLDYGGNCNAISAGSTMKLTFGAHISVIGIMAWSDPTQNPNTNYRFVLSNDTGSDSQHTFPATSVTTG
jgi:hypothetical protein